MSHLVCPLCGKNAPLSTLDPEKQPLNLRTVSFRGLGRGKGFAVSEETSIMGDEEYTPIIAKRIQELFNFFVENGEIILPIITNDELYSKQIDDLKRQIHEKDSTIYSLSNELNEVNNEIEINKQVDYIIRESMEFKNVGITADEDGWYIAISPDFRDLLCYLFLIMPELPSKLKGQLLQHVKRDGYPLFYDMMLKNFPRRQSIPERMMDVGSKNTIEVIDKFGRQCVRIFKPTYYPEYAGNSIKFEHLKSIVTNVKKSIRDPEFNSAKEVIEILFPLRLKLPLIREDSNL